MSQESIVYGYIKSANDGFSSMTFDCHLANRKALMGLPTLDTCSLLTREMFSAPSVATRDGQVQSSIIHFGSAYHGVEYEWALWIEKFETLLQKMYWDSVTVQLETELSGTHTFTWDSGDIDHTPSDSPLNIRCEWQHELGLQGRRA